MIYTSVRDFFLIFSDFFIIHSRNYVVYHYVDDINFNCMQFKKNQ